MDGVIATVIVGLIVAAVIVLAAFSVIKDKKQGKSTCGSSCGGCPNAGACHRKQ
ncbi:MAG: FeoB-associated Cys-rich membrane protein [Ruminococcus sp.]|nr:FeoB-associated Cys-rich membrane protein [Ruminococcus sp.]